jgi:hypothetical protein
MSDRVRLAPQCSSEPVGVGRRGERIPGPPQDRLCHHDADGSQFGSQRPLCGAGGTREGAGLAEITAFLDLSAWPTGHPGGVPTRAAPPRRPMHHLRAQRLAPPSVHHNSGHEPNAAVDDVSEPARKGANHGKSKRLLGTTTRPVPSMTMARLGLDCPPRHQGGQSPLARPQITCDLTFISRPTQFVDVRDLPETGCDKSILFS